MSQPCDFEMYFSSHQASKKRAAVLLVASPMPSTTCVRHMSCAHQRSVIKCSLHRNVSREAQGEYHSMLDQAQPQACNNSVLATFICIAVVNKTTTKQVICQQPGNGCTASARILSRKDLFLTPGAGRTEPRADRLLCNNMNTINLGYGLAIGSSMDAKVKATVIMSQETPSCS